MNNKVLVKIIIPELDDDFDCFIPVNELVWKIKKMLVKSVSDLTSCEMNLNKNYVLINKDNSKVYNNNDVIIATDIRNGTELYLMSI